MIFCAGFFLVVSLPGVILILIPIRNRRRAKASLAWPSVEGRLTSSQLVTIRYHGTDSSYVPRVEYEYSVAGQAYAGKRIAFGPEGSYSEAKERAMVDRYKVGTAVEVFYDPTRAAFAILEKRAASSSIIFLVIGVGLFTAAVGGGVYLWFATVK